MKRVFNLAAPYLAVAVFWCGFSNGWAAILAYHAQILFWNRWTLCRTRPAAPTARIALLPALPAVLAGPLLFLLLPHILQTDLATWLRTYRLDERALLLMIPYFGLFHPLLEQWHWEPLRRQTRLAHPLFAGYHVLVLWTLLPMFWLLTVFVLLTAISILWSIAARRRHGQWVPLVSHILADTGIILAAWLHTVRMVP